MSNLVLIRWSHLSPNLTSLHCWWWRLRAISQWQFVTFWVVNALPRPYLLAAIGTYPGSRVCKTTVTVWQSVMKCPLNIKCYIVLLYLQLFPFDNYKFLIEAFKADSCDSFYFHTKFFCHMFYFRNNSLISYISILRPFNFCLKYSTTHFAFELCLESFD